MKWDAVRRCTCLHVQVREHTGGNTKTVYAMPCYVCVYITPVLAWHAGVYGVLSDWGLMPRSDVIPLAAFNKHFPVRERAGRPPLFICKVRGGRGRVGRGRDQRMRSGTRNSFCFYPSRTHTRASCRCRWWTHWAVRTGCARVCAVCWTAC